MKIIDVSFKLGKSYFFFGIYRIMKNYRAKQLRFIVGVDHIASSRTMVRRGFQWYKFQNKEHFKLI